MTNPIIEQLRKELPPVWARTQTDSLTGNAWRGRTIANLMSRGEFPKEAYTYSGRKCILVRDPFLNWAEQEMAKANQ